MWNQGSITIAHHPPHADCPHVRPDLPDVPETFFVRAALARLAWRLFDCPGLDRSDLHPVALDGLLGLLQRTADRAGDDLHLGDQLVEHRERQRLMAVRERLLRVGM